MLVNMLYAVKAASSTICPGMHKKKKIAFFKKIK